MNRHLDEADTQQILNALKRALNARPGWDLDPEWGHVYRTDTGRMRCRPIPVPAHMWRRGNGDPKNLLRSFRSFLTSPRNANERAVGREMRRSIPANLTGMYIVTETWQPPAHRTRAIQEARERGEPTPRFEDMPDRVESRNALAIDLDMRLYNASQPRSTMVLSGIVDDLEPGVALEGLIPELLFSILSSLLNERADR